MTTTRIGRPPKHEDRTHFGVQMPAHLRSQLEAAAQANRRSLSAEALARLEASFRDEGAMFSAAQRRLALKLFGAFLIESAPGVAKLAIKMAHPVTLELPDDAEKKRRWQATVAALHQARWASPEAEANYQRVQKLVAELNAALGWGADAAAAAEPDDEAA